MNTCFEKIEGSADLFAILLALHLVILPEGLLVFVGGREHLHHGRRFFLGRKFIMEATLMEKLVHRHPSDCSRTSNHREQYDSTKMLASIVIREKDPQVVELVAHVRHFLSPDIWPGRHHSCLCILLKTTPVNGQERT